MVKSYIVVPFAIGQKGKLTPGNPQSAKDEPRAMAAAQRLRGRSAGVIVLEQESDSKADIYAEPRLVYHDGKVPPELVEQLAA